MTSLYPVMNVLRQCFAYRLNHRRCRPSPDDLCHPHAITYNSSIQAGLSNFKPWFVKAASLESRLSLSSAPAEPEGASQRFLPFPPACYSPATHHYFLPFSRASARTRLVKDSPVTFMYEGRHGSPSHSINSKSGPKATHYLSSLKALCIDANA